MKNFWTVAQFIYPLRLSHEINDIQNSNSLTILGVTLAISSVTLQIDSHSLHQKTAAFCIQNLIFVFHSNLRKLYWKTERQRRRWDASFLKLDFQETSPRMGSCQYNAIPDGCSTGDRPSGIKYRLYTTYRAPFGAKNSPNTFSFLTQPISISLQQSLQITTTTTIQLKFQYKCDYIKAPWKYFKAVIDSALCSVWRLKKHKHPLLPLTSQ